MSVLYAIIAFCVIAAATDSRQPLGIPLVLLGYGLVLVSSARVRVTRTPSPGLLKVLLVVGALQLVVSLAASELVRRDINPASEWGFFACICVIGFLILTYAVNWRATRRWRLPLMLVVYGVLAAWMIVSLPQPGCDVWHFQQNAAKALLAGSHPYDISMPNLYPQFDFYGPGVVRDGQVYGFPYPPLSLLLVLPGYLLGDIRWAMLAAHLALACVMVKIARTQGYPAGHHIELIPLALLCQPASLMVVQLGWTESLFALAMALMILACQGADSRLRGLTLAAVWSIKQYSILLPWTQWRSGMFRWRDFVVAAILTAATMIPFFVWNAQATWYSIVEFQFLQPTRSDSYSLNAILLHGEREPLPTWFSLAAVVVVAIWVSSQRSAIRQNMSFTAAAVLLTLFVTTNAFFNYLWITAALLAIGIIAEFPNNQRASLTESMEPESSPESTR